MEPWNARWWRRQPVFGQGWWPWVILAALVAAICYGGWRLP